MELVANTVIAGRFRLESLLGRGGMGSVWRATHLGLDVPCAVKFIDEQHASSPELRARFEREAKAAAQLRSPHVVQILDHGVFEGTPYIAMELLDGEDLRARLKKRGRLTPQEVAQVIDQIARALLRAHQMGIVHRDLKPENVFLVKDEDREVAKVLDFGIAKAQDASVGSHTRTGALLGTPYYMSPEQAQGNKAVDWRSDLWSLAVIAYECMTGRKPFDSDGLGDLFIQIIAAPRPVPSHVAPVPPAFDAFWARASEASPDRRFQSARELADALHAVASAPLQPLQAAFAPHPQAYGAPYGGGLPTGTPIGGVGRSSTASPIARTIGNTNAGAVPAPRGQTMLALIAVGAVVVLGGGALGAARLLVHKTPSDGTGTSVAAAPPPVSVLPPAAPSPVVASATREPPSPPSSSADPSPAAPQASASSVAAQPAGRPVAHAAEVAPQPSPRSPTPGAPGRPPDRTGF